MSMQDYFWTHATEDDGGRVATARNKGYALPHHVGPLFVNTCLYSSLHTYEQWHSSPMLKLTPEYDITHPNFLEAEFLKNLPYKVPGEGMTGEEQQKAALRAAIDNFQF